MGGEQPQQVGAGAELSAGGGVAGQGGSGQNVQFGDGGGGIHVVAKSFEEGGVNGGLGGGQGLLQGAVEAVQGFAGFQQGAVGEIQYGAVAGLQQQQAHGFGGGTGQHVAQGEEIAQGFGHLLAVYLQHAVMQPDAGEMAAREGATGLGAFVFVVRENQVGTAPMDVEILAEIAPGHRRALDMPAGAAAAPGARPAGQVRRAGFPEHEITRLPLVRCHFHAGPGDQVFRRTAG